MYQQPDPAWIALYVAIEVIAPIAFIVIFVWLAAKVAAFLARLMSHDGGISRQAQLHRHRLENLTAFMAFCGYVTGIVLLIYGPAGGPFSIQLPGGFSIENAGVPVILLAIANSILWILLNAKKPQAEHGAELRASALPPVAVASQDTGIAGILGPMSYGKAALITAVLLPFINLFAIPIGIFLAVQAAKRNRRLAD
jgi:hypothetical protein